jgi:hypothetical protein
VPGSGLKEKQLQAKKRIARLAAAVFASCVVAGGLTAGAAPAMATGEAQHCAVDLQTRTTACATSESQAARLAGISPQAVKAVTLYDGINYTPPSYTFYVAAPCTPTYEGEYGNPNLQTYGNFNNRASSVHTYNQCDVHLHDPFNYGSPYSVWIDNSANLANIGTGWSNRASSIGVS